MVWVQFQVKKTITQVCHAAYPHLQFNENKSLQTGIFLLYYVNPILTHPKNIRAIKSNRHRQVTEFSVHIESRGEALGWHTAYGCGAVHHPVYPRILWSWFRGSAGGVDLVVFQSNLYWIKRTKTWNQCASLPGIFNTHIWLDIYIYKHFLLW